MLYVAERPIDCYTTPIYHAAHPGCFPASHLIIPNRVVIVSRFFENPLIRALSSLKLGVVLMIIFAVAIAKATFIENDFGAEGARALVYNAHWFEFVLILLMLNQLLLLIKRIPYAPRQTGFVIVHISIILILVSAGITRYFGYEGTMRIREGETVDYMYSRESRVQLIGETGSDSFPVRLWRSGPMGDAADLTVDGRSYRVEMSHFWPNYTLVYEPSDTGPAALRLTGSTSEGDRDVMLVSGESETIGDLRLRYLEGELPPPGDGRTWGGLQVRVDGEVGDFPVPDSVPASYDLNGWRFTITEFQASFSVGAGTDYDKPMNNPMIRVGIRSPEGVEGERILFAFHPEFSMAHQGLNSEFEDMDMVYSYDRGLLFARGEDGSITARASTALHVARMDAAEPPAKIAPGTAFAVEERTLMRDPNGAFSVVLDARLDHVTQVPGSGRNERSPDAARVVVRGDDGVEVSALVTRGSPSEKRIQIDGRTLGLKLGPVRINLPYSIELEDFKLLNYPGSRNPASYESHVKLHDPDMGIDGRPVRIYMNHPLSHRGFKHFQSSYDPDELGTVLSVNFDPGKWPTYVGYILISLGFVLIFTRNLIWPEDKNSGGNGHEA